MGPMLYCHRFYYIYIYIYAQISRFVGIVYSGFANYYTRSICVYGVVHGWALPKTLVDVCVTIVIIIVIPSEQ